VSAPRPEPTARTITEDGPALGAVPDSPPPPPSSREWHLVGEDGVRASRRAPWPVRTPRAYDVDDTHELTVIVPTRNEHDNVAPLVDGLTAVVGDRAVRVLFVDDSDDATPQEVVRVGRSSDLDVDLLHRPRGRRGGGLGGAVLEGLAATESPYAVVMDGDLQHPPGVVAKLLDQAHVTGADVVVASRHAPGGSEGGLSNVGRVLVSRGSIALSKLVFPRRLRGVSDPMSGFFLVRRAALDPAAMRPQGFKILLELLARHRDLTRSEVAFEFGERLAGTSKASLAEGLVFVRQLARLRVAAWRDRRRPPLRRKGSLLRAVSFAAVGVTGLGVNLLAMWLLADPATLHLYYLAAAVLSTQASSTWNFLLVDRLVYRGPKRGTAVGRYAGFLTASNAVLLLRVPVLALLVGGLHVHYLLATSLTLFLGYFIRFRSQERLTLLETS
jgi:dolichol-phosphate mannosyltransferase